MNSPASPLSRNGPCPCGSGRKYKHCCGAAKAPQPVRVENPLSRGLALLTEGRPDEAQRLFGEALRREPENATAHYLMGHALLRLDQREAAASAIRRALDLGLSDPAAFHHYGLLLVALGRVDEAIPAFTEAFSRKPDFAAACVALANCRFELGQNEEAKRLYLRALELEPGNLSAWRNLAQLDYQDGRIAEAVQAFARAAADLPQHAELHACLATMLELEHRLDEAGQAAQRALALEPDNATAAIARARLLRRSQQFTAALSALDAGALDKAPPRTGIAWWNERAKNLEALARHAEAFAAYGESKRLLGASWTTRYRRDQVEQSLAAERTVLVPERVAQWALPAAPAARPIPVFIVGFFRSGTTLLEQMLGGHPGIAACGELETLPKLQAEWEGYPHDLAALPDAARRQRLDTLRQAYLAQLAQRAGSKPQASHAIDKLPLNLLRLPLIRLLFPDAVIIHMFRHPLDSALSAYFTPFLSGNEWSHHLPDTAHLLVEAWRHAEATRELPGLRYLRVRYEDLVAEPRTELERVLAFLGLDWRPECLDFQKSDRIARTASYEQVTHGLYQTSRDRYRRFLDFVDAETLGLISPLVSEMGYELAIRNGEHE